jgi:hypothetical protein
MNSLSVVSFNSNVELLDVEVYNNATVVCTAVLNKFVVGLHICRFGNSYFFAELDWNS